ncbi:hypothetical protein L195_g029026 [Trifolium pratense]|uniref:Uncharacterized protein n=1 Tax=Trifolium pratense TaxID=57577 RepID=A0A2K3L3L1_TRIPR|nr:hypothetical protein L195_g029026 [Trifolium pratense]
MPKPHHHDHGGAFVGSGGEQNQAQPNFDFVDRCLVNDLVESGGNKRKAGELVESSTTTTTNQGSGVNSSSQRNFSRGANPLSVRASLLPRATSFYPLILDQVALVLPPS